MFHWLFFALSVCACLKDVLSSTRFFISEMLVLEKFFSSGRLHFFILCDILLCSCLVDFLPRDSTSSYCIVMPFSIEVTVVTAIDIIANSSAEYQY